MLRLTSPLFSDELELRLSIQFGGGFISDLSITEYRG
jgi:hypothetical protein